jgi:ABC-type bacteriocin/lantibiotic exporter with double-glycine peptidase domain
MNFFTTKIQRLIPLWTLYHEVLGWRGAMQLLFSGLGISILQLSGLALIFPFLKLITDQDFHNSILMQLSGTLFHSLFVDHHNAILLIGFMLVCAFLLLGLTTVVLMQYQAVLAAKINSQISSQLITDALTSRYQLFVEHSSIKIAGMSYSHTMHVALLFQSVATGVNELLLISILFFGLFIASPLAFTGLMAIVFFLALTIFLPISQRVAIIGRRTQEVDLGRHRFVFSMSSAIRDIKIMGLESIFIKRNNELVVKHAGLTTEYATISTVQRTAIEVVLFCGLVFAAILFVWADSDLTQMAPTIVTLALVVVRCAPALSRLAASYSSFRYSFPIVEALMDLRRDLGNFEQKRINQDVDLQGEYSGHKLSFSYGERQVLFDCSFSIGQGEVVAVVGPSGSGKSTLLDLIAGLQPPNNGHFTFNMKFFSPFLSSQFTECVGYVPQSITLLDGSIAFNIALEDDPDLARLERAVESARLTQLVANLPQGLQTQLGEGGQGLSGGQRQRLGIARALYREPAFLILDEVTSALDEATARAIMVELLAMRGKVTMLFVTHDLSSIKADRVYQIDQGHMTVFN